MLKKNPTKLGQPLVRPSAKNFAKTNLDESKTVVSGGGNAINSSMNGAIDVVDISSDGSSAEEDDAEDSADEGNEAGEGADVAMEDAGSTEAPVQDDQEAGEPSFGDLVRANISEHIDVAGAFNNPSSALTYPQHTQIQPPSGASLGTVLTQALKTNDVALLESCLHTIDQDTIRATILRLDSPLAGSLLQKLAERLHRRPGRAGSLMIWVQYTLVAHGGYLATQTDLMKKLKELNKVIDVRSRSLTSLLSLKGKLDMLEAQIELRRSMQNQGERQDDDDDEEGIIYVEGQEREQEEKSSGNLLHNGDFDDFSDEDSDMSDDMPTINGVVADSDESGDESSDGDNLIDDEAEESEDDDEDDVDHGDIDSEVEEEESDEGTGTRPAKIQKTGGSFAKKK